MAKKKLTQDEYLKKLQELSDKSSEAFGNPEATQSINAEVNNLNFANPIDAIRSAQRKRASYDFLGPRQGTFQSEPPEPTINFVSNPNEKIVKSKNGNAAIVFGRDRPSTTASGRGGKGHGGSNTIDIVVGRMSCKQDDLGKGKIKGVDPHFGCDASRIYISQLTDVDLNFGIAAGISGRGDEIIGRPSPSRAAIGIKSDKVRVIGREGVKIVTGRSYAFQGWGMNGETNSLGGRIPRAAPIELIAGNNSDKRLILGGLFNIPEEVDVLQGVPYGDFTRDALLGVGDLMDTLIGAMDRLVILSEIFTSVSGITVWEPWRASASPIIVAQEIIDLNMSMHALRIGKALWETNFCTPYGQKYIVSHNVFAT